VKIFTLTGTRPEIIRLSETIKALDSVFDHTFIHSGQNLGANMKDVFFDDLDLRRPDIEWQSDQSSLARIIASTMENLEGYIKAEKPNAMVTLGDTNSALSGLIARRYGITTYHIEAGNRSFDPNVPEEVNRRVIDHFSDFNLAYSTNAYNNLIYEGLHPRNLMLCGSPMREVIEKHLQKIQNSKVLEALNLHKNSYFLVSAHRQENINNPERLKRLWKSLNLISDKYQIPCLVSVHPRTRTMFESAGLKESSKIVFHEPFGFLDYCALQMDAFCVLSDSGTISEESSILGFSAVTIRDSIERPEALETGSIMMAGLDYEEIERAVSISKKFGTMSSCPEAYLVNDHSSRVVKYIQSTAARAHIWSGLRKSE